MVGAPCDGLVAASPTAIASREVVAVIGDVVLTGCPCRSQDKLVFYFTLFHGKALFFVGCDVHRGGGSRTVVVGGHGEGATIAIAHHVVSVFGRHRTHVTINGTAAGGAKEHFEVDARVVCHRHVDGLGAVACFGELEGIAAAFDGTVEVADVM